MDALRHIERSARRLVEHGDELVEKFAKEAKQDVLVALRWNASEAIEGEMQRKWGEEILKLVKHSKSSLEIVKAGLEHMADLLTTDLLRPDNVATSTNMLWNSAELKAQGSKSRLLDRIKAWIELAEEKEEGDE
jgi:hypothetical protein